MASQPLTLTEIFGDGFWQAEIVEDVYGDGVQLLLGHIDVGQAQARIEAQPWYTNPALCVDALEHAWVRFDLHAPSCDHAGVIEPGTRCPSLRCSWAEWIRWHWHESRESDPRALAVTFAQLEHVDIEITEPAAA